MVARRSFGEVSSDHARLKSSMVTALRVKIGGEFGYRTTFIDTIAQVVIYSKPIQ